MHVWPFHAHETVGVSLCITINCVGLCQCVPGDDYMAEGMQRLDEATGWVAAALTHKEGKCPLRHVDV